jgi:hypothetical protein
MLLEQAGACISKGGLKIKKPVKMVLIALAIVIAVGGCVIGGAVLLEVYMPGLFSFGMVYDKAEHEVLVERNVRSIDYDPRINTVYLLWSESLVGEKTIFSFDLDTEEKKEIDAGIEASWIGVGREGELYVSDELGSYVLVYRDNTLTEKYEINRSGDFERFMSNPTANTYLGITRDFKPNYIITENPDGTKKAYCTRSCEQELFPDHLDYLLENNLQNINALTFKESKEGRPKYIWVNSDYGFNYRVTHSGSHEFFMPIMTFQGKRYAHRVPGGTVFPTSGNFFDKNGNLIYRSVTLNRFTGQ